MSANAATPGPLVENLARPTTAYRLRAWLAVVALLAFVAAYFGLAAWFALTAWRLTIGTHAANGGNAVWGWLLGGSAAFLAVFMLKAVVFVQRGSTAGLELRAQDQPELFAFLHDVADRAGAPRPHRVFVSAQVNAAVFYDLSLLNLVFPSKKNLEIGLGLVNSLSLGEFRAVLAHEFGHFAQRAMAVGRWVYVAQQIAAQLVNRRDKLDAMLRGLSNFDFRIAWIGWLIGLVVWSIRSLVDTAFRLVVLLQRALSREMEMNADLVAVSLTGSDALIHALHRLQPADDGFDRAVGFVMGEKQAGRLTRDLFAVQSRMVANMGRLYNDPAWGASPAPGADGAAHRVFQAQLAQPPQMWATHPPNHEREANAKRHYVRAEIDARSAWVVFADADALREKVTAQLLGDAPGERQSDDATVAAVDAQFDRELHASRYRGVHFGRSLVRGSADVAGLYEAVEAAGPTQLDALYPAMLTEAMERLRRLEQEHAQLNAVQRGDLSPAGGVLRHRGRALKRGQLPRVIAEVAQELDATRETLRAHDRRCRSLHRAAAAAWGNGWDARLEGLLGALHYADHTEDDLIDLQGVLRNRVAVHTATRKVNAKGLKAIVAAGSDLHAALDVVYRQAADVQLEEDLRADLGVDSWSAALGPLGLPPPRQENLGEWLEACEGWVSHTLRALAALRVNALDRLLKAEAQVADHVRAGTRPEPAGPATIRPARYATLAVGGERPRQTRLGWWARFQLADGVLPATARLVVAGGIVAAVLGLGGAAGSASVTIHNGLARIVEVDLGGQPPVSVPPLGHVTVDLGRREALHVATRTGEGQVVEQFDADVHGSFGRFVYNVAGAAPLVEWTAVYGGAAAVPERRLGGVRWTASNADVLFEDPPQTVRTKGGGATRSVLGSAAGDDPQSQLSLLADDAQRKRLAETHARWDALESRWILHWFREAREAGVLAPIVRARLAETPGDLLLLGTEVDLADEAGREALCRTRRERSAAAPADENLRHAADRCLPPGPARDQAFVDGHARAPRHAWFAYAAATVQARRQRWGEAIEAYAVAQKASPVLAEMAGTPMARLLRLTGSGTPRIAELAQGSQQLRNLLALETGQGVEAPELRAYADLAAGRLDDALRKAGADTRGGQRVLRLAAASDGAGAALVARALALPPQAGIDDDTVWYALALAAREKQDTAPLREQLQRLAGEHAQAFAAFVDALVAGRSPEAAAALLEGGPPELRSRAYAAGLVVLGRRAPAAWRDGARRLLFAPERPYFS